MSEIKAKVTLDLETFDKLRRSQKDAESFRKLKSELRGVHVSGGMIDVDPLKLNRLVCSIIFDRI